MNSFLPQLEYTKLSLETMYVIDVRSPQEYEDFHLPFSINIPLLSNEERKEVGTLYKQVSPEAAKKRGMEIFALKLPKLYDRWLELEQIYPNKQPVVMCARGGMRSGVFVSMMHGVGIHAMQLNGGIRSVRRDVQRKLEEFATLSWDGIVLSGNTGTGKTKWLL